MEDMLLRNARFNPSIAVPIIVTVKMPMTMPSVVNTERNLLARMAPQEMLKPSVSSVKKFILFQSESANAQNSYSRFAAAKMSASFQ
jgi:hypothetical protein